jgi:hypothetical protein
LRGTKEIVRNDDAKQKERPGKRKKEETCHQLSFSPSSFFLSIYKQRISSVMLHIDTEENNQFGQEDFFLFNLTKKHNLHLIRLTTSICVQCVTRVPLT